MPTRPSRLAGAGEGVDVVITLAAMETRTGVTFIYVLLASIPLVAWRTATLETTKQVLTRPSVKAWATRTLICRCLGINY